MYPRFGPTMEWDTAAGDAVLRYAGGRVEYLDSSKFTYGKKNFKTGKLKNTDKFGSKLVRLPIHTNMRKEDANNVVKCINKVLKDLSNNDRCIISTKI